MGPAKMLALAGATALMTTAANAADFPQAIPQPIPQLVQAPAPIVGGFYLRGDVGVGNQSFRSYDFTQTNIASGAVWPASWHIDVKDIKDTFFVGFGFGYSWNSWLRTDVTAEYRADVKFKAVGSFTEFCLPGTRCSDLYDGDHQAWVALINAYLDLGTWWCLTPFIGVGVGGAYHTTSSLTDVGHGTSGGGFPISVLGFANSRPLAVDFCLGSACWRRLRSHIEGQDRVRLPLPEYGLCADRRGSVRTERLRHGRRTARLLHSEGSRLARLQDRLPLAAAARSAARLRSTLDAPRLIFTDDENRQAARVPPAPFVFCGSQGTVDHTAQLTAH